MPRAYCQLFVTELETTPPTWAVQVQVPLITLNLVARDLEFLRQMRDFVTNLGNPEFRDTAEGGTIFRRIPLKQCDLSKFFTASVYISKDGEYDDAYVPR